MAPQYLGWYNPLNKETSLNAPRIQHWIQVQNCISTWNVQKHPLLSPQVGAEPSDTVNNLLKKAMVIEEAA